MKSQVRYILFLVCLGIAFCLGMLLQDITLHAEAEAPPQTTIDQLTSQQIAEVLRVHGPGRYGNMYQNIKPRSSMGVGLIFGGMVTHVTLGGPAQRAGLRVGDVVTKLNGAMLRSAEDLIIPASTSDPGTVMKFRVSRLDPERGAYRPLPEELSVTLVPRPQYKPGAKLTNLVTKFGEPQ